jgi:glycosyltransferase involved in cell wall biosynthesis/peptidoglycan/xylan/chitin deacetylase (PgdA/CDA1 family)
MKILVITNLFPNTQEPTRAVFNFQQVKALKEICDLKVVAPVVHFRYSVAQVSLKEDIEGIETFHPRYFVIPKIMRFLYGWLFYLGIQKTVKELAETFRFDVILATWAYPDAFAAALIARKLHKPLIIKVHGSDINILSRYPLRRAMMTHAFQQAHTIIAVTQDLRVKITAMGIPAEKILVIPNGIDPQLMYPMDKINCRNVLSLPLDKKIVCYIGNLVGVKGIDLLIKAFFLLKKEEDIFLAVVGDGPLKPQLLAQVGEQGMTDRIRFFGVQKHDQIPLFMNAADIHCLPSRQEGCPNVVLEAIACGRPVVATQVGGVPEIIVSENLGITVPPENPELLANALKEALSRSWDHQGIHQAAKAYRWEEGAKQIMAVCQNSVVPKVRIEQFPPPVTFAKTLAKKIAHTLPRHWLLLQSRKPGTIALTFDDGPHVKYTPQTLDILKKEGIVATFFLIGQYAQKHPQLTERIIQEGHAIGMHSYSHNGYPSMPLKERVEEIRRSQQVLQPFLGRTCQIFRPPQGAMSVGQFLYCLGKGITTVLWNRDSLDFKHHQASQIRDEICGGAAGSGHILLFHDDNEHTVQALPDIIRFFKKQGLHFLTIEEMLA